MTLPHGFGIPLVDFASFVVFAYLASGRYRPPMYWQWVFFVLFVLIAVLFFFAWAIDLGAHI
jgi:hypothetical protein